MARKIINFKKLLWVDIDDFSAEDEKFLLKNFHFHPLALKDCYEIKQNPKLDVYRDYLFLIFNFIHFNKIEQKISSDALAIFMGKNYIITVHNKFKKLKNLFYLCSKNLKIRRKYLSNGADLSLYKLIDFLFRKTCEPAITFLGQKINELEKEIFSNKNQQSAVRKLVLLRRDILNCRSIIEPQKFIIKSLANLDKQNILNKDLQIYFDDLYDYLEKIWVITTNYKEQIEGLNETNESLISHKTNQIITTLTIISVALMPLTLLSSIYGMNIPLPLADSPNLIWFIFFSLLVIILLALLYLKKKNRI